MSERMPSQYRTSSSTANGRHSLGSGQLHAQSLPGWVPAAVAGGALVLAYLLIGATGTIKVVAKLATNVSMKHPTA